MSQFLSIYGLNFLFTFVNFLVEGASILRRQRQVEKIKEKQNILSLLTSPFDRLHLPGNLP